MKLYGSTAPGAPASDASDEAPQKGPKIEEVD